MKRFLSAIRSGIDQRDIWLLAGLVLLGLGGERLLPGAGVAAVGIALVYVAIWVK